MSDQGREGGLDAPTRHPLNQDDPAFWDEADLNKELERVYDICHGCRRCVSLCNAFPTLFDLIDASETLEVDGVAVADYTEVVDQCYLCDLCYLTKCPYVPPHEWNLDFPHVMLRAKAVKFSKGDTKFRDRLITSTDLIGKVASKPLINNVVNGGNKNGAIRSLLDKTVGIHKEANLPEYVSKTARKTHAAQLYDPTTRQSSDHQGDKESVTLFTTCYCNYSEPSLADSIIKILQHNEVTVELPTREHCCGMPKLELGDLPSVRKLKEQNIPILYESVQRGNVIMATVPSCVLMFKQELPLMFPEDEQVKAVAATFHDPFEYLFKLHKQGKLKTDFNTSLGNVSYHVACHQRVQKIGPKTRQILELIEGTEVKSIERCSGHDGTYGVKKETLRFANKIVAPIVRQIKQQQPDYYGSDCPIAGKHIEYNLDTDQPAMHPIDLLLLAYGLQ
ncbi:MAG TPA: heterodisulfide reductase-related iron-sulfur binding cluster [Gammaproteobacteria bacterium]|jgi:Fe-S oxidoreductase|nr:heterodisulfide reductase-related iron-sulfur binding cluster [Gammaproteobacteria bacterium]|tara:strand:+ start:13726 stop:15072 length:1347 start_codon:yes stop_codon:yes gene_type:complete